MECGYCRRTLALGRDALGLQKGVLGPRGFVPLEEMVLFCSELCLRAYFNSSDEERVP